jgi:6-phosphofructokinase 1
VEFDLEKISRRILKRYEEYKTANIIVVAEGASNAYHISDELNRIAGIISKITVLGHLQRGGSPTAYDRLLGSRFGANAVSELVKGKSGCIVGLINNAITFTSYEEVLSNKKTFDDKLIQLARTLAG